MFCGEAEGERWPEDDEHGTDLVGAGAEGLGLGAGVSQLGRGERVGGQRGLDGHLAPGRINRAPDAAVGTLAKHFTEAVVANEGHGRGEGRAGSLDVAASGLRPLIMRDRDDPNRA